MSAVISPGPKSTYSGSPLPLVAMPADDLLTVNIEEIPLLRDAIAPGLHIQPLRLDPERGEWVVLATLAPGCSLPIHYHTGPVQVWTFQGRWMYREYPDQVQTAGSYLYEPGGGVHTFYCPEDNTEDTVALAWIEGAAINFHEDGTLHSVLDATAAQHAVERTAVTQGTGPVPYLHGGGVSRTDS